MLINVTQAIGELSILYPVSGGFYTLAVRFLDPSFAFAMGWNYVFQWAIVLPLEITVAGQTVLYWEGAKNFPLAGWITIFWIVIGTSKFDVTISLSLTCNAQSLQASSVLSVSLKKSSGRHV
jgi:amino acid permease